MARSPGNKTYSKQELTLLLTVLEEVLPISSLEWTHVMEQYVARKERSWSDRAAPSLRRKFANLWSISQPNSFPALRALARSIKTRINMRYDSMAGKSRLGFDGYHQSSQAGIQRGCEGLQSLMSQHDTPTEHRTPTIQQRYFSEDTTSQSSTQIADTQQYAGMVSVDISTTTEALSELTGVRQFADVEPSQHEAEMGIIPQDHSSGDSAPRPSLMDLYHKIIQFAVEAQLDADRRDVVREQREREERQGALVRQQKMMSLIAALLKSKQT